MDRGQFTWPRGGLRCPTLKKNGSEKNPRGFFSELQICPVMFRRLPNWREAGARGWRAVGRSNLSFGGAAGGSTALLKLKAASPRRSHGRSGGGNRSEPAEKWICTGLRHRIGEFEESRAERSGIACRPRNKIRNLGLPEAA